MATNAPSNIAPLLSSAGMWQPVAAQYINSSYSGTLANTFYETLPLGSANREGIAITGWAYQGDNAVSAVPVNMALFEQNADGTLRIATSNYISDPKTNGGGSVIVADFNLDGRADIFLAAHNESPFVPLPSTVYLSNETGNFTKLILSDSIEAHDAELAIVNGTAKVLTASFGGDIQPIYTWSGSGFTKVTQAPNAPPVAAMSVVAADFNGDGKLEIVFGEAWIGPSFHAQNDSGTLVGWQLENDQPVGSPFVIGTPYFNNKPEYSNYVSFIGAAQPTHIYRVWADDFNHDGKLDIVAGESIFGISPGGAQVSMLQMFQNMGGLQFKDVTDTFNPSYNKFSNEVDYSMRMVDLDHSGINSYLSAVSAPYHSETGRFEESFHNNFLIVNDGTGRLYYALHDEFVEWGKQVLTFVNSHTSDLLGPVGMSTIPAFIGYQTSDGYLNFVAQVSTAAVVNDEVTTQYQFVNVPVHLSVDSLITAPITITDRNGSHLIRTFSGDDTIFGATSGGAAHLDGGSGLDTAVYSGQLKSYEISRLTDGSYVVSDKVGNGGTDTLVNFERVQFADQTLAIGGLKGLTSPSQLMAELYLGYYNRAPDVEGLNYWISNYTTPPSQTGGNPFYQDLVHSAAAFADPNQAETIALYPFLANPSVAGYGDVVKFVTDAYINLFGRTVDGTDQGVRYWATSIAKSLGIAVPLFGDAVVDQTSSIDAPKALIALIFGAQGNDALTIANKVAVGLYYQAQLSAHHVQFTQASAHNALSNVSHDLATVVSAEASIDAFIASASPLASNASSIPLVGIVAEVVNSG